MVGRYLLSHLIIWSGSKIDFLTDQPFQSDKFPKTPHNTSVGILFPGEFLTALRWFVLMEMTLVAVMTVYLAYHTPLLFAKAKYRKIITTVIIGILIGLCLYNLIFFLLSSI